MMACDHLANSLIISCEMNNDKASLRSIHKKIKNMYLLEQAFNILRMQKLTIGNPALASKCNAVCSAENHL